MSWKGRIALLLVALAAWTVLSVVLAFYGTWLQPVAKSGEAQAFSHWAKATLSQRSSGTYAFALIESGELIDEHFGGPQIVDGQTLFPTASLSKWIAALTIMSLVEQGQLELDRPISDYLTRWQLPSSAFDNSKVTIRRLLSHTGGLTDGLGFADYAPDEEPPPVLESLRSPRASNGKTVIQVGAAPGEEFRYSGGGYLILEALVEEVTGNSFPSVVNQQLLQPLQMHRSTYADLNTLNNTSSLFDAQGTEVPTYRYASAAATGFASSAGDLTQLALALLSSTGESPLQSDTLLAMRRPEAVVLGAGIWGLGTMRYAESADGEVLFGHDGANEPGINSAVRLAPISRSGIVLLSSGTVGLASEIAAEWVLWKTGAPDLFSTERAMASALQPALLGGGLIIVLFGLFSWRKKAG